MGGGSVPEVLQADAQDLLSPLLPLLISHLEHVAHEGGVSLGVRQLVGVDVSNGADDSLRNYHSTACLLSWRLAQSTKP